MVDLWVLIGDLNVIARANERRGGAANRSGVSRIFVDWLQQSGLLDLGFVGPRFTWKRGSLYQRLDRALCNTQWRLKFLKAVVRHLVRYQSDHRPLLLDFFSLVPNQRDRPFRFIQAWMTHADYRDFVAMNWVCNGDLVQDIKDFISQVYTGKQEKWYFDVYLDCEPTTNDTNYGCYYFDYDGKLYRNTSALGKGLNFSNYLMDTTRITERTENTVSIEMDAQDREDYPSVVYKFLLCKTENGWRLDSPILDSYYLD